MSADLFTQIITIIVSAGSIVAVYVKMNNRITILETKLENKTDLAVVMEKIDAMRTWLEGKLEKTQLFKN